MMAKLLFYTLGPLICGVSLACLISYHFSNASQLIIQLIVLGLGVYAWFVRKRGKK
jgi:hypothetical protein